MEVIGGCILLWADMLKSLSETPHKKLSFRLLSSELRSQTSSKPNLAWSQQQGHTLRVTITRKVVVYAPAERAEKFSQFALSPYILLAYNNVYCIASGDLFKKYCTIKLSLTGD
jgi:hypothetical protein